VTDDRELVPRHQSDDGDHNRLPFLRALLLYSIQRDHRAAKNAGIFFNKPNMVIFGVIFRLTTPQTKRNSLTFLESFSVIFHVKTVPSQFPDFHKNPQTFY